MERSAEEINNLLSEVQTKWFEIVRKWVSNSKTDEEKQRYFLREYGTPEFGFSEPFLTGIYSFDDNLPVVMFVGQETNGWGCYNKFENYVEENSLEAAIKESQKFTYEFTKNNLDKEYETIDYHGERCSAYDNHGFWNFIRQIYKNNQVNVVWTELDKIHYTCCDDKCIKLWGKDEIVLNKIVSDGKTMLLHEIETIKPDLVVFLTGPGYAQSMRAALPGENLMKPTKKEVFKKFEIKGIPCVWTYHPSSLCRQKVWDKVIDELKDSIEEIIKLR